MEDMALWPEPCSKHIANLLWADAIIRGNKQEYYHPSAEIPKSVSDYALEYLKKNTSDVLAKRSNVSSFLAAIWDSVLLEFEAKQTRRSIRGHWTEQGDYLLSSGEAYGFSAEVSVDDDGRLSIKAVRNKKP